MAIETEDNRTYCTLKPHNFIMIGSMYAKYAEIDKSGQQSKLYSVVFCSNCGETKEIIVIDRGPVPEGFQVDNPQHMDTPNLM